MLNISNISKSYGTYQVLDNLSLELHEGEIIGLLGRNGVGKTTLLKIIAGISLADNGTISYPSDSKNIGYLSERNPLYPDMYIPEYLNWISDLTKGNQKLNTDEVISKVGLSDMVTKKIGQLSKGYKQRVGLAAAMISNPEVLILDEPINGLDPVQIEEYRQVVKELGKDRIVILSSHLMQEVEAICDRVVMINDGSIERDFVLNNRASNLIIRLELNNSIPIEKIQDVTSIVSVEVASSNIYKITAKEDVRVALFDLVVENNVKIIEMSLLKQKLDKLF